MAVSQRKPDKKGNKWVFRVYYTDLQGNRKQYESTKFPTKKTAQEEERKFLLKMENNAIDTNNMTFKDLRIAHYEAQKRVVKKTTMHNYDNRISHMKEFDNIKLKDLSIQHVEKWKEVLYKKNISNAYRNDLLKYFKAILNYGTKWYGFNFAQMYNKITNFTDPNEVKKEMSFYTFEEFQKFISKASNIHEKAMFETFYYCGLRRGELRALTWADVDFNNNEITINKNCVEIPNEGYLITSPKTKSSNRIIPIPNVLKNDLQTLYNECKTYLDFNDNWYVFGTFKPIYNNKILDLKKKIIKDAGVKYIRLHDFRHSCASLLINNGANITLVAKYLGHTKIEETLNTYSHLFKNKLDDIINIIDNLNNNN